jgi:hypothetical protein
MVHLFNKEEVVSPGAFALGETSFLRIDPWSFPRLKPQPSHPGEVAKGVEMKLDIQWWATTEDAIVGLIPLDGKTIVIKSDHDGNFVGYKADEVTLQHLTIAGETFRLYAVCRKGRRVEEIRLLNPVLMDLLGVDPNKIIRSTTFN